LRRRSETTEAAGRCWEGTCRIGYRYHPGVRGYRYRPGVSGTSRPVGEEWWWSRLCPSNLAALTHTLSSLSRDLSLVLCPVGIGYGVRGREGGE
jgi:hypothetical protein